LKREWKMDNNSMIRNIDHIEHEVKEIRKDLLSWPDDVEAAADRLLSLRNFLVSVREQLGY